MNENNTMKTKKLKPKKIVKNIAFILLIVVCLGLGFVTGHLSNRVIPVIGNKSDGDIIDEVEYILDQYWVDASGNLKEPKVQIIKGMLSGIQDPHTAYLTSEEANEFNQAVDGSYVGIGVGYSMVEEGAMITKVYDNSPASSVKLKVGDIIIGVDGKNLKGKDSDAVKELVRGKENTTVKLTIKRGLKQFDVTPTRKALDTSTFYEIRKAGKTTFGYIELSTYGGDTAKQVEEALQLFQKNNIKVLVLDLRDNGGGYLQAAQDILDLFFTSDEVIYQMQTKNESAVKHYAASDKQYVFDTGYILVNGSTASASEMTAGALQSEKGFKLIGETTYGKGSAQRQTQLSDGSVLKYTYAKWMIPNGTCINGKGLEPDIEVSNASLDDITIESLDKEYSYDQVDKRIASMQKMLNILGYSVDRSDGYFSKATEEALKQFEKDNYLVVDGKYQERDKLMLVSKMLIYISQHENDTQYNKLLELLG